MLILSLFKSPTLLIFGVILVGFGYGIMQPLIYDKAAIIAPPQLATKALSIVMAANYTAIILCPFIINAARKLFANQTEQFGFLFNGVLAAIVTLIAFMGKKDFALGLDSSYYSK